MSRILIAGCGYVGSVLARRLTKESHEVWALRRRPERIARGIPAISADLTKRSTLVGLPDQLAYVFFTAAARNRSDEAYRATYVDGLRNLLDALAAAKQPIQRVFFTSSTAVYAQDDGAWVDEDSPAMPSHFTGLRMLEAEQVLRSSSFAASVLRLGGVYGPDRTRLIDQVRRGEARCPPEPRYVNRIHRDDAAAALQHLMQLPEPEGVYLGVDHAPADLAEVLGWLAGEMGVAQPQPAAPAAAGSNKRCRNTKLVASGYEFIYPTFREGYQAMLSGAGD